MDYANRRRLKLLGHLTFVAVSDADPDLSAKWSCPATVPASSAWH